MAVQPLSLEVPPLKHRKRIPQRVIRALVQHIVNRFNPERIILFGSYAYGEPQPWSDVDLLVVKDVPQGREIEAAIEICQSLPRYSFGLDIVVRSKEVIERRIALGDLFLREITTKGKVMYERDDGRVGRQSRKRFRSGSSRNGGRRDSTS